MKQRAILVMAFAIFIGMGWLAAAIGPALPDLAKRTGVDLAAVGAIFSAVFTGSMIGQSVSGPLNDRLGQRPVLIGGTGIGVIGMLGVVLSSNLVALLACGAVYGLGFGALDVTTNVLIARTFAGKSVPALNLLHVFYGVGSAVGPAVVGLSLRLANTGMPGLWIGAVVMLTPMLMAVRLTPGPAPAPTQDDQDSAARDAARNNIEPVAGFSYRMPLVWALGGVLGLFVGVEAGMSAWTATYVERSTVLTADAAALVTSGFWLALTLGRVAGAAWGERFTAYAVLWMSLLGMLAGAVLLAIGTGSVPLTIAAVLVLGFCAGPPFPTIVAIGTATFRDGQGKATAVIVAMGSLSAAILPWLEGNVLDKLGESANALFILVLTGLMVALYAAVRRAGPRRASAPTV
jgi:MFS transporter, FHS family, glucose/mannose:H+ symporter